MSKETDLKTKLDPSNMKMYNKMKLLKILFSPEASKMMENLLSGRESMVKGAYVAFSW
jgi:hypothetical protein